jgi:hypothetical protein
MAEWCMAHPWMTFWMVIIVGTSLPSIIITRRK